MLGFRVMLQNDDGHYSSVAHALKFEGSMLIYDPQRDITQWVLVRGVMASLTMMELRLANDLSNMFPSLHEGTEPVQPPSLSSWLKGIPVGVEFDSETFEEDSGEEWDKKEHGDWSCCPSLLLRMGHYLGGGACHSPGAGGAGQKNSHMGQHIEETWTQGQRRRIRLG